MLAVSVLIGSEKQQVEIERREEESDEDKLPDKGEVVSRSSSQFFFGGSLQ